MHHLRWDNDLQRAKYHVKQAEDLIERQKRLLQELLNSGHCTRAAWHQLFILEESVARMKERVDFIERAGGSLDRQLPSKEDIAS